jgi:hypothetical protein
MFAEIQALLSIAGTIISVVRAMLPDVIALVGDVHDALPNGTTADKVEHVEQVLKVALADMKDLPVSASDILPALLGVAERHLGFLSTPAIDTTI